MSWFSVRPSNWPKTGGASGTFLSGTGVARTADELAADLEQQARQVGANPQNAADLLERWAVQSDETPLSDTASCYTLPATEACGDILPRLSFREVLLRSRAFEAVLETCVKTPSLGAALKRHDTSDASQPRMGYTNVELTPLGRAISAVAERLLLPGTLDFWPSLLEAVLSSAVDDAAVSGAAGGSALLKKIGGGNMKWGHWARRVLVALKRGWLNEALPGLLRQFDRRLCELAARRRNSRDNNASTQRGSASSASAAAATGGRLSRAGIKAALALEQLENVSLEATELSKRSEILCDICERVEAAELSRTSRIPKLERLLMDAGDALQALDANSQELSKEQENLTNSLGDLGGELQKQITATFMTEQSFREKRSSLQVERSGLVLRLKEIDAELAQLEKSVSESTTQVQQLQEQLRGTTAHFESKIAESHNLQKHLNGEKFRAVTCQECAHLALDVARTEAHQVQTELDSLRRRHHVELRRTFLAYIREEHLRLEAATQCVITARATSNSAQAAEANNCVQTAWQTAESLLRRVEALGVLSAASPTHRPGLHVDDVGGMNGNGLNVTDRSPASKPSCEGPESLANTSVQSGIYEIVEREKAEGRAVCCVDCGADHAEWASVTFAVYLCEVCAGHHRGLGVHVSFVRSVKMDRWEPAQCQRMALGGTARFQKFLDGYPSLRFFPPYATQADFDARYTSRAAVFYRQRLDQNGDGRLCPPAGDEGHLPGELASKEGASGRFASTSSSSSRCTGYASHERGGQFKQAEEHDDDDDNDDDVPKASDTECSSETIIEEWARLKASVEDFKLSSRNGPAVEVSGA